MAERLVMKPRIDFVGGHWRCRLPIADKWYLNPRLWPTGYASTIAGSYHNWRLLCRMGE